MSNLKLPDVTDYVSAAEFLGPRPAGSFAYATTIHRDAFDGSIHIRHFDTNILTYTPDGTIILYSAGYVTATTATRMHRLTPANVFVGRKSGAYVITRRNSDGTMTDLIPASARDDLSQPFFITPAAA